MMQSLVGLLISFNGSQGGQDIPKWVLTRVSHANMGKKFFGKVSGPTPRKFLYDL